ncbi:MAG TPA: hypothetical protein VHL57_02580, partial [Flavobacteriales bacterium]|nr:hypothetical protein [Flavobacteriales bacterium]
PIFILVFGLLFTALWGFLGARGIEPNTPVKFDLGLLQLGLGFVALWYGAQVADPRGMVGVSWLLLGYLLHTTGELCLSPIGLSLMTKLSPVKIHGLMMGMWFLASAYGQYMAGILGAGLATTGEYRISMAPEAKEATSDLRTIAWQDTSENKAVFERMDIVMTTKEADTSKFEWKPIAENTTAQFNAKGDTVAWRMTEITNDGSERVALPGSLIQRKDADLSVAPRPLERLKTYTDGYGQLGLYALISGVVLILISPFVRKLMRGVH